MNVRFFTDVDGGLYDRSQSRVRGALYDSDYL